MSSSTKTQLTKIFVSGIVGVLIMLVLSLPTLARGVKIELKMILLSLQIVFSIFTTIMFLFLLKKNIKNEVCLIAYSFIISFINPFSVWLFQKHTYSLACLSVILFLFIFVFSALQDLLLKED